MINMNEAKAPDSTTDWQNIDIYLFSNGQLNSPPRKYHLRSEELNWWDATLNFLARSQYGSMHSRIDLYTTNGHILEGPLQLQNGGAYVAVEKPNTFIDAGYDKYLLKASRSMEKRQAKRPNSKETILPAENTYKAAKEIMDSDNGLQKDKDVAELSPVHSSDRDDDQEKMLEPQALLDTQMLTQNVNSSTTKQIDKRKTFASQNISSLNPIQTDTPLAKATKSLEKGPAKRGISDETMLSVHQNIAAEKTIETATDVIMVAANNEVQKDNFVVESAAVNSSNDQDKPLQPQALLHTRRLIPKSNSSATKETDKRKLSLTSRPAVVRKVSNLIPTDPTLANRKTSLRRSNSPPKRTKLTGKTNERPSLEGNIVSKTVPKSISKIHSKILEAQHIVDHNKTDKVTGKLKDSSQTINTVITPNQKSQVTDNNQVDNLLNDKDLIIVSDLYKNPVTDMTSAIVDTEGNTAKRESITQELIKINEESETSQASCREFPNENLDKITQKHKVPKNPSKIKFTTNPSFQAYSVSEKANDSYLAILNRGDILNFRLKIEVRNADGAVSLAQKIPETKSTANLMKLDKSSQVRIDNDLLLQSKTLYSTYSSEHARIINSDGNSKILVVQCGCCEHYCNQRHDPTALKENSYIMRFPTTSSRERFKCVDDFPNEKAMKKTVYKDRSSIVHVINKTYSDMSLERLHCTSNKGPEFLIRTQDMSVPADNSTNLNTNVDHPRNDIVTSRHCTGEQQVKSECNTMNQNPFETKKSEYSVIQKGPTNYVDKSTQTEWCNILLEARCHADGRYTFHLPPLNVLKSYTI